MAFKMSEIKSLYEEDQNFTLSVTKSSPEKNKDTQNFF